MPIRRRLPADELGLAIGDGYVASEIPNADGRGIVRLRDVRDGRIVAQADLPIWVSSAAFARTDLVVTGYKDTNARADGGVVRISIPSLRQHPLAPSGLHLDAPSTMVTRGIVHVSPDGTLVAVNRCGPDGCETQVVDLASGEVFRPQRAMTGFLRALTDETIILTGGQHGASDDRAWVLALGARDGGRRWHVADQGLRDPVAARHGSLVGVLGSRRSGFALARIDRTGHVRDLTPRRSAPIPWVWREVSSPDLVVTSMVGSFETALASPRPVAAAVIDVAGGVRLIDPMWIDLGVEPTGTDDRPASAYASVMDESLSTTELAWVLGRSSGSIRRMIRDGELESIRIPAGFRVPKTEALRVARERIEAEAGRKVSDRELEALIDQVIATNDAAG